MADFAAAGATQGPCLTRGVRREVVVQEEALFVILCQRIDELRVLLGAQGGRNQSLGLATGEQRRAVGPRQGASLAGDQTNLVALATVDALARVQNQVPEVTLLGRARPPREPRPIVRRKCPRRSVLKVSAVQAFSAPYRACLSRMAMAASIFGFAKASTGPPKLIDLRNNELPLVACRPPPAASLVGR